MTGYVARPGDRGKSKIVGRGRSGTGEHAHVWAEELRTGVERHPLPIEVPDPGTAHGRALVLAFGAAINPRLRLERCPKHPGK